MPRCPTCRTMLRGSREDIGARCTSCREPLYEWPEDDDRAPDSASGRCAAHPDNRAVGTCQRCGNYVCSVCETRWRGRLVCAACVERALEANEATPEEARTHLRQGVLGLVFGLAAWLVSLAAILLMAAGFAGTDGQKVNVVVVGLGFFVFMASPLLAVLGIGQAAAAIRTRGDHMILATSGLILSGLNAAVVVGMLGLAVWKN